MSGPYPRRARFFPHRVSDEGVDTDDAEASIEDYAERTAEQRKLWETLNGEQLGDPAELAQALLTIARQDPPPRRFIAGADAIGLVEQKVADLQERIDANRDLSTSLARDDVEAGVS